MSLTIPNPNHVLYLELASPIGDPLVFGQAPKNLLDTMSAMTGIKQASGPSYFHHIIIEPGFTENIFNKEINQYVLNTEQPLSGGFNLESPIIKLLINFKGKLFFKNN